MALAVLIIMGGVLATQRFSYRGPDLFHFTSINYLYLDVFCLVMFSGRRLIVLSA